MSPTTCPPLGITARARIERVIDGDTLVCEIRDTLVTIRLLDCWAPERGTLAGKESSAAMQTLAQHGDGCIVHVPTGDAANFASLLTFGRVLAHVWLEGDETSLSEHMRKLGHATAEKVR